MRPTELKTRIFLDSGDPEETKAAIALLGFLDGQTTNPSLIAKNPQTAGKKFTLESVYDFYKGIVSEISSLIPQSSVSIEVYADKDTKAEVMLEQGKKMFAWIPNAHIKYPTTSEGLKAATESVEEGIRINLTLVFSQQQAAAVYAASKGAKKGDIFLSPFVGRLDDIGQDGMDLIKNILMMYQTATPSLSSPFDAERAGYLPQRGREILKNYGHVEVLTASVRSLEHFLYALALGSDIITAPFKIIKQWAEAGMPLPAGNYQYQAGGLQPILYEDINLDQPWQTFDLHHDLTDKGVERFAADWNSLINS